MDTSKLMEIASSPVFWAGLIVVMLILAILSGFIRTRRSRHGRRRRQAVNTYNRINEIGAEGNGWLVSYLRKVEPFTFEEIILYAFSKRGYKTKVRHRYTHDGGIDGCVVKDNKKYYIQAKRYKGYVRKQDVADFCALCHRYRSKGFFITTGLLSDDTRRVIESDPSVLLIDSHNMSTLFLEKKNGK